MIVRRLFKCIVLVKFWVERLVPDVERLTPGVERFAPDVEQHPPRGCSISPEKSDPIELLNLSNGYFWCAET